MAHHDLEALASRLHHIGSFKDKTLSPGGQGFRLKLHEKTPDAPLSPFYLDLRLIRSFPDVMTLAARVFRQMMFRYLDGTPARIADVPTAITPVVSVLSLMTNIGMVTPREPKKYGTEATIDGVWEPGDTVVLFDDLITKADSKITAIETLQKGGLKAAGVIVLVDRLQGGSEHLESLGYGLYCAFTIKWLLEFYHENNMLSAELRDEISQYLADQVVKA